MPKKSRRPRCFCSLQPPPISMGCCCRSMAAGFSPKRLPRFSREALCATAPLGVLAFWGGLVMAGQRYPSQYDWRYMTISSLVYPDRDPGGYLWAWAGIVLCGLGGLCWVAVLARNRGQERTGQSESGRWGWVIFAWCVALGSRRGFFGFPEVTIYWRYRLLSEYASERCSSLSKPSSETCGCGRAIFAAVLVSTPPCWPAQHCSHCCSCASRKRTSLKRYRNCLGSASNGVPGACPCT